MHSVLEQLPVSHVSVLTLTKNSFTGANALISGVEMGILEVHSMKCL